MKNQKETIRKLIGHLNNEDADGGFWLPNIQRPFVWSEDQIERLFDSIMRQYPISTLLIWKTKSGIKHRKFIDNYKQTLRLTDFYVPPNSRTKRLVLDGQQRLQSLFIALKGSYEGKELHFDVLSGDLVAPEDIRYRFRFVAPEQVKWPWVKFKSLVFGGGLPHRIAEDIIVGAPIALDDPQRNRIRDNVARAMYEFVTDENIAYQELDSIDEPDPYNEEDVVEIFIRANSGGTKLGKSDLLFSLLTSSWDEADLEMEQLLEELNKGGFAFDRDFVLKSCLTLLDKGARYEVTKFRLGETKEKIIEHWDKIADAIKAVKDYVAGKTFIRSDYALTSNLALIPLIYFRYHYPEQWAKTRDLRTYLLRVLLCGAFSGRPDNLIDQCVARIREQKEFQTSEIFDVIRADGRSLEVTPESILGQEYGSKGIHLVFNLWYEQFDYTPAFEGNLPQVDHIFPQSLLRKIKIENPETGKKTLQKYGVEVRNQIANCMLLTAAENGAGGKGDISPDEWFADKDGAYLDLHLIPKKPELWELDSFEEFLNARKALILDKFGYMLQTKGGA